MHVNRALERAILAQIAYLEGELKRIRAGRGPSTDGELPVAADELLPAHVALDDDPMVYALRDPGYQRWLLQQQLEER